jgi:hypothetical protein
MHPFDKADQLLLEQLNAQPELKTRVVNLLAVISNAEGNMKNANAAEQKVIEELRRMGHDVLQGWAEHQITQSTAEALSAPSVQRRGKKIPSLAQ